jgi:hypothetical protein
MPKFEKGHKKVGGRTKGVKNKIGQDVKNSLLFVYETIGGDKSFSDWAKEEKTEFYKMYSKLLPTELEHTGDIQIIVNKNAD